MLLSLEIWVCVGVRVMQIVQMLYGAEVTRITMCITMNAVVNHQIYQESYEIIQVLQYRSTPPRHLELVVHAFAKPFT